MNREECVFLDGRVGRQHALGQTLREGSREQVVLIKEQANVRRKSERKTRVLKHTSTLTPPSACAFSCCSVVCIVVVVASSASAGVLDEVDFLGGIIQ